VQASLRVSSWQWDASLLSSGYLLDGRLVIFVRCRRLRCLILRLAGNAGGGTINLVQKLLQLSGIVDGCGDIGVRHTLRPQRVHDQVFRCQPRHTADAIATPRCMRSCKEMTKTDRGVGIRGRHGVVADGADFDRMPSPLLQAISISEPMV
jgi:hypothetical protein